jgi:hypothetical protein
MRVILRIRLPQCFARSRVDAVVAQPPKKPASTFSATLQDHMEDWLVEEAPSAAFSALPFEGSQPAAVATPRPQRTGHAKGSKPAKAIVPQTPSALNRAWAWLQTRYTTATANKRLRVAETVALGEKRFVALVCVEGREFLIGGGSSGVSLLAQLEKSREPANSLHPGLRVVGGSE